MSVRNSHFPSVIARSVATRQPIFLDCFAVLAMTVIILCLLVSSSHAAQSWQPVNPGGGGGVGSVCVESYNGCFEPFTATGMEREAGLAVCCTNAGGGGTPCTVSGTGVIVPDGASKRLYSATTNGSCQSISQIRECMNGLLNGSNAYKYATCATTGASCVLDGQTVDHGDSYMFYSATWHATDCTVIGQNRVCNSGTLNGSGTYNKANCTTTDPCTTGAIGTVCLTDNAIYIGTVGGNRIYAASADQGSTLQWKTSNSTTTGTTSTTDGLANTNAMIAAGAAAHPAGNACATKAPAGTWYLPAKDELNLVWTNRGAINLAAKGFNTGGTYYWSSTEIGSITAWFQRLSDGNQNGSNKTNSHLVRCVRR